MDEAVLNDEGINIMRGIREYFNSLVSGIKNELHKIRTSASFSRTLLEKELISRDIEKAEAQDIADEIVKELENRNISLNLEVIQYVFDRHNLGHMSKAIYQEITKNLASRLYGTSPG